jgi:hypothetical protein
MDDALGHLPACRVVDLGAWIAGRPGLPRHLRHEHVRHQRAASGAVGAAVRSEADVEFAHAAHSHLPRLWVEVREPGWALEEDVRPAAWVALMLPLRRRIGVSLT